MFCWPVNIRCYAQATLKFQVRKLINGSGYATFQRFPPDQKYYQWLGMIVQPLDGILSKGQNFGFPGFKYLLNGIAFCKTVHTKAVEPIGKNNFTEQNHPHILTPSEWFFGPNMFSKVVFLNGFYSFGTSILAEFDTVLRDI